MTTYPKRPNPTTPSAAARRRALEDGRLGFQSPVATPRPHAGRKSKRTHHRVWLP